MLVNGFSSPCVYVFWILFLHLGSSNYHADILWGQCYAFCLTRHEFQEEDNPDSVVVSQTLGERAVHVCLKHKICRWCLFACERPREDYANHHDCLQDCKHSQARHSEGALRACNASCQFISKALQSKYGTCPASSDMQGFSTACVQECGRDLQCDGTKKCCNNGCGDICHKPLEFLEFPSVPNSLSFKERNDGGLLISWHDQSQNMSQPMVYIFRWWCSATSFHGARYSVATKPQIKLKGYPTGVPPAAKCSFMVAAVTVHGSEGYSPVQTYMKRFLNPSPPVNLETVKSELRDGKVDVTVRWHPPLYTDGLKVVKYLIIWSDTLPKAGPNYLRLHMKKTRISADRTTYTIPRLEPSAYYFVQVRAEVKWNEKTIRGRPVSSYVETHSFPRPAGLETSNPWSDESSHDTTIYNVTVHEPFLVSSQLKANVTWSVSPGHQVEKYILSWSLDVCDNKEASHRKTRHRLKQEATAYKREFQLYNLSFSCVYEIRIHPVTGGITREGVREFFQTKACWETQGEGLEMVCPPRVSPLPPPTDLSVHYKSTRGCMCQAVIRWQRLSDKDFKVNNYTVLWGQSRPPASQESTAIVYHSEPYTVQVPGKDNAACMTYLESDKHYTAQIIAQAARIKSKPGLLHFTTPTSMPYCYGARVKSDEDLKSGFLGSVLKPTENLQTTTLTTNNMNPQEPANLFLLCLLFAFCLLFVHGTLL